eukprot:2734690-Pleurochrysis_carterae.AAC.1
MVRETEFKQLKKCHVDDAPAVTKEVSPGRDEADADDAEAENEQSLIGRLEDRLTRLDERHRFLVVSAVFVIVLVVAASALTVSWRVVSSTLAKMHAQSIQLADGNVKYNLPTRTKSGTDDSSKLFTAHPTVSAQAPSDSEAGLQLFSPPPMQPLSPRPLPPAPRPPYPPPPSPSPCPPPPMYPPQPTPPLLPPPAAPDAVIRSTIVSRMNERFVSGHPTPDMRDAGVLIHMFDALEEWSSDEPWKLCRTGWCLKQLQAQNFFSASIVNKRLPNLLSSDTAGFVMAPDTKILCAYAYDGGTQ